MIDGDRSEVLLNSFLERNKRQFKNLGGNLEQIIGLGRHWLSYCAKAMGHDPEMNRRNVEPGQEQSAPRRRLTSLTAKAPVVLHLTHVKLETGASDEGQTDV